MYMKFCDDLLNIYIEPHQNMINNAFTEIFLAQLRHLEKCWKSEVFDAQVSFPTVLPIGNKTSLF